MKHKDYIGLFVNAMIEIFKQEPEVTLIIDDKILLFLKLRNVNQGN